MKWQTGVLWVAVVGLCLMLYGAWAERTRHLLRSPAAGRPARSLEEEMAYVVYVNNGLGEKAKTSCQACNPQQEKLLLGLQGWSAKVGQIQKVRRQ